MELAVTPPVLSAAGRRLGDLAWTLDVARSRLMRELWHAVRMLECPVMSAARAQVEMWDDALSRLADSHRHLGDGLSQVAELYAGLDRGAVPR